jgi:flagellar motor switch protein FliG
MASSLEKTIADSGMDRSAHTLKKAAMVIASLDCDVADQILEQMPTHQSQWIRHYLTELPTIDRVEQGRAIREFLEQGSTAAVHGTSGWRPLTTVPDVAARPAALANHLLASAPSGVQSDEPETSLLAQVTERLIAECLNDEMPQAVAVALADLPTQRVSDVIAQLPASLQTQVLERLVELDPATTLELAEVRDEFHQWFNQQIQRALHRSQLASRLATILDSTHAGTREQILQNVQGSDARLAKELQQQMTSLAET